jgi:hypothetical protein
MPTMRSLTTGPAGLVAGAPPKLASACAGVVRRAVTVSPTPRPVLRANAG